MFQWLSKHFGNFCSQVKELYASNQLTQLDKVLAVLRELAHTQNAQSRKGGLIGLAAAAIALSKVPNCFYRSIKKRVVQKDQ